jgi:hypothetical protein
MTDEPLGVAPDEIDDASRKTRPHRTILPVRTRLAIHQYTRTEDHELER